MELSILIESWNIIANTGAYAFAIVLALTGLFFITIFPWIRRK